MVKVLCRSHLIKIFRKYVKQNFVYRSHIIIEDINIDLSNPFQYLSSVYANEFLSGINTVTRPSKKIVSVLITYFIYKNLLKLK